MTRMSIQGKLTRLTALLAVSIFVIWGVFYLHTANNLRKNNQQSIQQISEQIIARMESELLSMEQLGYTLAGHPVLQEMLAAAEPREFYRKSGEADALLLSLHFPQSPMERLVVFDGGGRYADFGGLFGATANQLLHAAAQKQELPRYTVITLENVRYIAYMREISGAGSSLGALALLSREDQFPGLFSEYITAENIQITMLENGVVVSSNQPELLEVSAGELEEASALLSRRKIRFAPFELCVGVSGNYLGQASRDFGFAAIISEVFLFALLFLYLSLSNRHFLRPMVGVIENVSALGGGEEKERLQQTGEESFDQLVGQVNHMLERLEERSESLLKAQSQLQNTEIERQRALIVSLKKQIDAHFTVNVLNVIKVLSGRGENEKAADMADGLSHLLRYANEEDEFVSGLEELYVLQKYITIMEIRYPDRFQIEFEWDDRLVHAKIPRMLLQPIIENAIVHGLAQGQGAIEITAALSDKNVVFQVKDNGQGIGKRELARIREEIADTAAPLWTVGGTDGIALANIQRRVRSYYGEGFGLQIDSMSAGGTVVRLEIPVLPPAST